MQFTTDDLTNAAMVQDRLSELVGADRLETLGAMLLGKLITCPEKQHDFLLNYTLGEPS